MVAGKVLADRGLEPPLRVREGVADLKPGMPDVARSAGHALGQRPKDGPSAVLDLALALR